ncbi:FecCD family ABC transporter permease [Amycolatopsis magusensis]|uniref:FecCD family ABC transporter permease n=1 Tax=Amycolatopsis magusensis TaxID=882444 RepID=UPI0037A03562
MTAGRPRRGGLVVAALAATLGVAAVAGVAVGSVPLSPGTVLGIVTHRLTGLTDPSGWTLTQDAIVWDVRLPRVLFAAVAGAGLAMVGVAAQVLVANPLADPFLLGVSSGAALGAVTSLVTGVAVFGVTSHALAGFVGALAAFSLVWLLATRTEGGLTAHRLLLTGVLVSNALLGATSYVVLQAADPSSTHSALFWLFGSLADAGWDDLGLPTLVVAACGLGLFARARGLNALQIGEEHAAGLGVPAGRLRAELFAVTSLITGVLVALCGCVHFVGLVTPHLARRVVGHGHRRLLPVAALTGAVFLVLADLAARTLLSPEEIPVGILTTVAGAAFALAVLARRGRRAGRA